MKALIIADDLTGALDTGAAFAAASLRTRVCVRIPVPDEEWTRADTDVLSINAQTRHLAPEEAFRIVYGLCAAAKAHQVPCIYKKTDSALRGNVGAELAAMRCCLELSSLPFVPAYPVLGRTVRDGILYIDGVPAVQTALGKDSFDPLESSVVSDILQKTAPKTEADCIEVYDAQTDADLLHAGTVLQERIFFSAGCGGFAKVLAARLTGQLSCDPSVISDGNPPGCGGMLLLCGSLHNASLSQVRCAKAAGLPVHALPAHPQADFVQLICEELDSPGISILSSEGLSSKAEADTAGEALLRALCPSRRIRTLCVFGGDTFAAAMNALDISTLHICRELFPGVVLSAARTDQGRLFVISKAGSFGSPDLIVRLHGALRT